VVLAATLGAACAGTAGSAPATRPASTPGVAQPSVTPAPVTTPRTRRSHRHRAARVRRRHRHARTRIPTGDRGIPAADLPDRTLTPGAVLTESTVRVCTPGYASSVRNVPQSESDAVYARYGVVHVPYQHEVDHLVSLELGGSNAVANLWPEPYAGRWGARTKDALENRLHDLVCAGAIGLRDAQHIEATDWVAAYRRYLGAPPPAAPVSGGGGGGGTAPTGSGCTPGYTPCLPEHGGADYDCAGGGGNGPYFTTSGVRYRVTGSDPYRLDGNGDGYAC
jgi:hypothetical protein